MNKPAVVVNVPVFIEREGRRWVVSCPALCLASDGKTKSEAQRMFYEAADLAVDVYRDQGKLQDVIRAALQHPTAKIERREVAAYQFPLPGEMLKRLTGGAHGKAR